MGGLGWEAVFVCGGVVALWNYLVKALYLIYAVGYLIDKLSWNFEVELCGYVVLQEVLCVHCEVVYG